MTTYFQHYSAILAQARTLHEQDMSSKEVVQTCFNSLLPEDFFQLVDHGFESEEYNAGWDFTYFPWDITSEVHQEIQQAEDASTYPMDLCATLYDFDPTCLPLLIFLYGGKGPNIIIGYKLTAGADREPTLWSQPVPEIGRTQPTPVPGRLCDHIAAYIYKDLARLQAEIPMARINRHLDQNEEDTEDLHEILRFMEGLGLLDQAQAIALNT